MNSYNHSFCLPFPYLFGILWIGYFSHWYSHSLQIILYFPSSCVVFSGWLVPIILSHKFVILFYINKVLFLSTFSCSVKVYMRSLSLCKHAWTLLDNMQEESVLLIQKQSTFKLHCSVSLTYCHHHLPWRPWWYRCTHK